jgi:hypothetical protein
MHTSCRAGEKSLSALRGEREGPAAKLWEGEVGDGDGSEIPHLTPSLSAPRGGEGDATATVIE